MSTVKPPKEHRCPKCERLLAMEQNGELVIRSPKLHFSVSGGVIHEVCPRCKSLVLLQAKAAPLRQSEATV